MKQATHVRVHLSGSNAWQVVPAIIASASDNYGVFFVNFRMTLYYIAIFCSDAGGASYSTIKV